MLQMLKHMMSRRMIYREMSVARFYKWYYRLIFRIIVMMLIYTAIFYLKQFHHNLMPNEYVND